MLPLVGQLLKVNERLENNCKRKGNVIGSIFKENWWKSVGSAAEFNLSLLIMRTISRGRCECQKWFPLIRAGGVMGKVEGCHYRQ